ncbi:FG-GAP-like repeat-containing protein [Myxococcota bacterium]|nr:FG-GAP-like repeat-containing protein [Myxococcota bacterium]
MRPWSRALPLALAALLAACTTEPSGDDDSAGGDPEVCDGVDNDLDGEVDEDVIEGAPLWHPDADGDGYGDLFSIFRGCEGPEGYVEDGSDCDDTDPEVSPAASETCDGLDEDCDGYEDEDAVDAPTWYRDEDGDGFGDAGDAAGACGPPYGYVGDDTDCQDGDSAVFPGAPETCGNGVDDDCDGEVDTDCSLVGTVDLSAADGRIAGTVEGDGLGCAVASAGDVDGDGIPDVVAGACGVDVGTCTDTDSSGCDGGGAYVFHGPLEGAATAAGAAATFVAEAAWDAAGTSVAAGDLNGDGVPDLLIGAPRNSRGGAWAGAVYVVLGPVEGTVPLEAADGIWVGAEPSQLAGAAIATGDVDGDGLDDVIVGAPGAGDEGEGAVFVVRGPATGQGTLAEAMVRITGTVPGGGLGWSVAAAFDANGDGASDLLAGAPARYATHEAGAAALFLSPLPGDLDEGAADTRWTGEAAGSGAGWAVAVAGDTDGDGALELLVGAIWSVGEDEEGGGELLSAGSAYLVGAADRGPVPLGEARARMRGEAAGDRAGFGVAAAGDVDGDGLADVLVSAAYANGGGSDSGTVYLLYGPVAGEIPLGGADAALIGEASQDRAGSGIAAAGDFDGNGLGDLVIGAEGAGDGDVADTGAVYAVLGVGSP